MAQATITKRARELGLSNKEEKILDVLSEPMSISQLSRKVSMPRTSLYSRLAKLERRGLVEKTGTVRRQKFCVLKGTHDNLAPDNAGLASHVGRKELINLYRRIFSLKKHERLQVLQPKQSTEIVLSKFPLEELIKINKFIQKNEIIVEAVLHEDAISHFTEVAKKIAEPKMVERLMVSITSRVADTTYLPKEFLPVKSELWIIGPTAFVLNWDDEIGLEIKNRGMVEMLRGMFSLIKLLGKKVDQNPKIDQITGNSP